MRLFHILLNRMQKMSHHPHRKKMIHAPGLVHIQRRASYQRLGCHTKHRQVCLPTDATKMQFLASIQILLSCERFREFQVGVKFQSKLDPDVWMNEKFPSGRSRLSQVIGSKGVMVINKRYKRKPVKSMDFRNCRNTRI